MGLEIQSGGAHIGPNLLPFGRIWSEKEKLHRKRERNENGGESGTQASVLRPVVAVAGTLCCRCQRRDVGER